jgi:hypothetical protein
MRGRIRTIKPDIGKHEELWDLGVSTGLPVYQAFTLLWCYADREGRFEWRPRALKTDVLPYWDGDFSRVLDALTTRGFIVRYASGGREYGWIPGFSRHQVLNHRETASELPEPTEESMIQPKSPENDACPTRAPRVTDVPGRARGEGKGREGKGMGKEGSDASSTPDAREPAKPKPEKPKPERFVPDSFQPNESHHAKARELGVMLDRELQSFRCHEFRVPKTDWNRAFHGWLARSAQYGTSSGARTLTPEERKAEADWVEYVYGKGGDNEAVKAEVVP